MDWVITSQYPAHLIDTPVASSLCKLWIIVGPLIVLNLQTDPLFCSLSFHISSSVSSSAVEEVLGS